MAESSGPPVEAPSRKKIFKATLVAVVIAGVVLVTAVLPAEYGIDPLGIGAALGLVVLSEPGQTPAEVPVRPDGIMAASRPYKADTIEFELGPYEFVEYKYRLEEGASMVYSWRSTGPVRSEMHSEPDGAPSGTAEFFEVLEETTGGYGAYTAPFPGIHGWYWENLSEEDTITVTLKSAGLYSFAREFRADAPPKDYDYLPDAFAEAAP